MAKYLERKRPQKDKPEPKCGCRKKPDYTPQICAAVILYVLVTSIALAWMLGHTNDRVYRLENDSRLTYDMARDSKAKLDNLCTHFKTGCTRKYTGK